ncbi:hypothetical protein GCM10011491_25100 [Brucella endophytica]|uniref:DUF1127 domain-containing protein n=1 Tax=Brucella endophytica TaxID=1963359 RepID=A0A916WGL0_9HYPH|nr:hypothetical protein [Brucella endophytica]GGA95755.1 hypothetical protein GCM10011491_25100 [Brucella endophytica]
MGIVIPPIMSAILHFQRKMKERRDRARTRRLIDNLPGYVQRDIGWTGSCEEWQPGNWQLSQRRQKR